MAYHVMGRYDFKDLYSFEELPKGPMFKLAMNPYTGMVLIDFEKHEASTRIAYEVLHQIIEDCKRLDAVGIKDPLRKLCEIADKQSGLELTELEREEEETTLCPQE